MSTHLVRVQHKLVPGALSALVTLLLSTSSVVQAAESYIVENYGISRPLTNEAGDIERGKRVVAARELGNCLSCHAVPMDAEFFGDVGPSLVGVGRRLTVAQLRLRLVDPKQLNAQTVMPAYFKSDGLYQVRGEFKGKTILSAQQIEDIVAFLASLTDTQ